MGEERGGGNGDDAAGESGGEVAASGVAGRRGAWQQWRGNSTRKSSTTMVAKSRKVVKNPPTIRKWSVDVSILNSEFSRVTGSSGKTRLNVFGAAAAAKEREDAMQLVAGRGDRP